MPSSAPGYGATAPARASIHNCAAFLFSDGILADLRGPRRWRADREAGPQAYLRSRCRTLEAAWQASGCLGAALLDGALDDARRFAAAYRYVPRYVEAEDW